MIYEIRRQKVMLDSDLAALYGVELVGARSPIFDDWYPGTSFPPHCGKVFLHENEAKKWKITML
jgi:hypothetical protein